MQTKDLLYMQLFVLIFCSQNILPGQSQLLPSTSFIACMSYIANNMDQDLGDMVTRVVRSLQQPFSYLAFRQDELLNLANLGGGWGL